MKSEASQERRLLSITFLWVWVGVALVYWNRYQSGDITLPLLVALTHTFVFVGLHFFLSSTARQRDPLILPITSMLTGLGLVLIYDMKAPLVAKQCHWLIIAAAAILLITRLSDARALGRYKYTWMFLGLALMLATSIFGKGLGSSGEVKLDIQIGSMSFQASEFARLFLIIFLAAFLGEKRELIVFGQRTWWRLGRQDFRYLGPMLVMWGIALLFLVRQRDLGAALLFFGIFMAMLFMANTRVVYLLLGLFLFCGGSYFCYRNFTHVQTRINIWIDPWPDADNKGYQIVQSLFALGGGGLLGTGLGEGYSARVPAVHTDLIFSAAAEELGLAGSIALLTLFLLLVGRGFRIATRARDPMSMLLSSGLAFSLGLQVCIIVGGATKLIPLTGITLPFISYGGSSLVANAILIALLITVSREGG